MDKNKQINSKNRRNCPENKDIDENDDKTLGCLIDSLSCCPWFILRAAVLIFVIVAVIKVIVNNIL